MTRFELDGLRKVYPNGVVGVHRVDLSVDQGEFIALVGPSGCGKSTTLRMAAGFESCSGGRVLIDGRDFTNTLPAKRPTAMVFQDYALFPHLTVRENIAFGPQISRAPDIQKHVDELARILRLGDVVDRPIATLSGGQRQRVALARALSVGPSILLLDEPLGALDASLRKEVQAELKILQKKLGITFLFVTHSQAEALALSDRIVVMNAGWVEQISTPEELCTRPASRFVAKFIGRNLVLDGKEIDRNGAEARIETSLGPIIGTGPIHNGACAASINLDSIELAVPCQDNPPNIGFAINARIVATKLIADRLSLTLALTDGSQIAIERRHDRIKSGALEVGRSVNVCWKAESVSVVRA